MQSQTFLTTTHPKNIAAQRRAKAELQNVHQQHGNSGTDQDCYHLKKKKKKKIKLDVTAASPSVTCSCL